MRWAACKILLKEIIEMGNTESVHDNMDTDGQINTFGTSSTGMRDQRNGKRKAINGVDERMPNKPWTLGGG